MGRQSRFIPARAGNTSWPCASRTWTTVHPRPRGEHPTFDKAVNALIGSSPPARGPRRAQGATTPAGTVHPPPARGTPDLRQCAPSDALHRFIPARAGNTAQVRVVPLLPPVHPRPRGEHFHSRVRSPTDTGSSPPARGTPRLRRLMQPPSRFILARAGITALPLINWLATPVHPRPRGEHCPQRARVAELYGPSPPARGTQHVSPPAADRHRFIPARAGNTADKVVRGADQIRFIPARAGNTESNFAAIAAMTVHPRPRGEHSCVGGPRPCFRPTPVHPRPRGEHASISTGASSENRCPVHPRPRGEHASRIGALDNRRPTSVHPRPRGEHSANATWTLPVDRFGSSPPARGTRCDSRTRLLQGRFIPARAGNTECVARLRGSGSVHPRPRGEHDEPAHHYGSRAGSSPPARGTHRSQGASVGSPRFIPARAGNTH